MPKCYDIDAVVRGSHETTDISFADRKQLGDKRIMSIDEAVQRKPTTGIVKGPQQGKRFMNYVPMGEIMYDNFPETTENGWQFHKAITRTDSTRIAGFLVTKPKAPRAKLAALLTFELLRAIWSEQPEDKRIFEDFLNYSLYHHGYLWETDIAEKMRLHRAIEKNAHKLAKMDAEKIGNTIPVFHDSLLDTHDTLTIEDEWEQ